MKSTPLSLTATLLTLLTLTTALPMIHDPTHHVRPDQYDSSSDASMMISKDTMPSMLLSSKDTMASKSMPNSDSMPDSDSMMASLNDTPTLTLLKRMQMPNANDDTSMDTSMATSMATSMDVSTPTSDDTASSVCTIDTVSGSMQCPGEVMMAFRRWVEERGARGMGMGMVHHEEAGVKGEEGGEVGMGMGMVRK